MPIPWYLFITHALTLIEALYRCQWESWVHLAQTGWLMICR